MLDHEESRRNILEGTQGFFLEGIQMSWKEFEIQTVLPPKKLYKCFYYKKTKAKKDEVNYTTKQPRKHS